jgi:hypothetical protein
VDFTGITQDITITNLFIDGAAVGKSKILTSRFFTVTNLTTNRTIYGAESDTIIL